MRLFSRNKEVFSGNKPLNKKLFPYFSAAFIAFAIAFTFYKTVRNGADEKVDFIAQDISNIYSVLKIIDDECNILSIKADVNTIDFFTVKSFAGSEVGSLNLAHPDQWRGPYMDNNPSIRGKSYEIVRARTGYYIVPGRGVKLPNGFTIGTDLIIDRNSDVDMMLEEGGDLHYKGVGLAKKLDFEIGDWDFAPKKSQQKMKKIGASLKEFNAAMPYTDNTETQTMEVDI